MIKEIWDESRSIAQNTLGYKYFTKARGIPLDFETSNLKFHPNLYYIDENGKVNYHPSILGKIERDGEMIGIQRLYLNSYGEKLNNNCKKVLGKLDGGHISLGDTPKKVIHITEGIETGLAVFHSLKEPVWIAVNAGNLSKVITDETAKTIKIVHLWADKDKSGTGQNKALEAAKKYKILGITCIIHTPSGELLENQKSLDYLDVFNNEGPAKIKEELSTGKTYSAKPLPFKIPEYDLPKIDNTYLPIDLYEWMSKHAERLSVPPELIIVPFLSTVGAIIGRTKCIHMKQNDDHVEYANLWGMIISPPGYRKSHCLSLSTTILNTFEDNDKNEKIKLFEKFSIKEKVVKKKIKILEKEYFDKIENPDANADSIENDITNLANEIAKLKAELQNNRPALKQLVVHSATVEKIINIIEQNPNGILVVRDEIFNLINTFKKQGHETDRAFFLEGWNGNNPYSYDTVSRGRQYISNLCVTIIGGTQPSKLAEIIRDIKSNKDNDGFLQRFQLMVYPNKLVGEYFVDKPTPVESDDKIKKFLKTLYKISSFNIDNNTKNFVPKTIHLSTDAYKIYSNYFAKIQKEACQAKCETFASHLGKYHTLLSGLSLILFVINNHFHEPIHDKVQVNIIEMAIKWVELFKAHAQKIYSHEQDTNITSAFSLAQKIKENKISDEESIRTIYRHGWVHLKTYSDVCFAASYLSEIGWLNIIEKNAQNGRPSEILKFHPELENFINSKESGIL